MNLTPEQQYLDGLIKKYQANPDDPELLPLQRFLLGAVLKVEGEVKELMKKLDGLNEEIKVKQEGCAGVIQEINGKRGEANGYVNTLLAVKVE